MASSAPEFRGKHVLHSLAAVVVLVGVLSACTADGTEPVAALAPDSASTSPSEPPLERLTKLDLVREGTILAVQTARGVAQPAEFDTDGSHAFRVVCTGGGKLAVRTHASGEEDVSVACDGFTSGMRYLTERDHEVWSVDATDDQEWSIVWVDWDGQRD